jgi:hypothetical protein
MGDKLAEIRHKAHTESLDKSNLPRFGYFGFPGPLCIGDDSYAPRLVRKPKDEADEGEPIRNIQSAPCKKGNHPNVYFSFSPPLCLDDPYVDPHRREKKGKVVYVDGDDGDKFKPPGKIKTQVNKLGYDYVCHMDGVKDPKAVKEALAGVLPLRQIYTGPTKKGGGGVLTGGVLFGFDEERRLPKNMPEDYDSAKKARKKELDHHQALLEEQHPGERFKSMAYGNGNFSSNTETYGGATQTHIPRDPKPDNIIPYEHPAPFVPANPGKKGMLKGLMGGFPAHMPDPVPQTQARKKGDDEETKESFKLGFAARNPKPTPSVTTLTRNMRAERPASFARPLL